VAGDFGGPPPPRLLLRCVGNLRPRFIPVGFVLPIQAERQWPPPTPMPPSGLSSGFPIPLPAPPVFLPAGAAGSVAGLPAVGRGQLLAEGRLLHWGLDGCLQGLCAPFLHKPALPLPAHLKTSSPCLTLTRPSLREKYPSPLFFSPWKEKVTSFSIFCHY